MLLLLLSRDGESRKSLVCVRLLLCPGRLVRLSMLSVSDKRGATEYVLLCLNHGAYGLVFSIAWVSERDPSLALGLPCLKTSP
jgi:hypothetical protein